MEITTNSTCSETHFIKHRELLETLNNGEIKRLIPTVIFLLIICVGGIVGNSVIIHVYRTRYNTISTTKIFILCLSVIDLLTCCLAIPLEITTLLNQYTFENILLCKISRAFNTLGTNSSVYILIFIAIDRFRKVCQPFGWQIRTLGAKFLCGLALFLGTVLSCLALLVYGKHSFRIKKFNITATECSFSNEIISTNLPFFYGLLYGILTVASITCLWVFYCLIGIKIKKQAVKMSEKLRSTHEAIRDSPPIFHSKTEIVDLTSKDDSTDWSIVKSCNQDFSTSIEIKKVNRGKISRTVKRITTLTNVINILKNNASKRTHDSRNQARARQTSLLTFTVTLAFILSALPHQLLMLARNINGQFFDEMSDTSKAFYKFFLRSYFLNSAINPIIYIIFDSQFKSACKDSFGC